VKILFVCHRFPFPPNRGGKIRPFNIIRHFTEEGHDVTVATLVRSKSEAKEGEGLANYCTRYLSASIPGPVALARMIARLPTPTPSSMGYFYSPLLRRLIRKEIEANTFDLIFVHCAFVAPYVADIPGVVKVLDFGDMDSQKWLSYASFMRFPFSAGYYLDGLKLQRAETRLAEKFDLCTCTTRAELDTLRSYDTGVPSGWFPNGADSEYFKPSENPYVPDSLSFVGRMDYFPNQECMIEFCRTTLPLIRAKRSQVTLTIVGAQPSKAIRELGRLPGVTVTGSVPDVRPYVQRSAVNVAPLRIARGTQNKILEAMAMAVPVVASQAAAAGVDAEPGYHLVTCSTPTEYAGAIVRLLENPGERNRLAEAGRARVLSHHSWERSMNMLDRLIEQRLVASLGERTG
jgi:sugar transferase (PEP-CTERM/EpsH1 system associated)